MTQGHRVSVTAAAAMLYATSFTAQTTAPPPPPKLVSFSTVVGGNGAGVGPRGVAVDAAGRVHVAGGTCLDARTTPDAISRTQAGGCDAYIAIYSPEGALLYGTYLGGSQGDNITALALDGSGNIYVTGYTSSTDFPTTPGAYDRSCGQDGLCRSFRYTQPNYYSDAFVTKLTAMGKAIAFSTYLGGSEIDVPVAIAVDAAGRAHIGGFTDSDAFPWTPGAPGQSFTPDRFGGSPADGFYSRLSADGSSLLYSTYINGSSQEFVTGVAVDDSGAAYIGGHTDSTDFFTMRAMQPSFGGSTDGFLLKVSATGTLEYSTYLGREGNDYVWDVAASGAFAYLTGDTSSRNFPLATASGGTYIVKMAADGNTFARALMVPRAVNNPRLAADRHERAHLVGRVTEAWTAATTSDAAQPRYAGSFDVAFAMFTMGSGQPDAPLYATFFGGSSHDEPSDVAVGAAGNVYVVGGTHSVDFPFVNAPAGPFNGGGFITRFSVEGIPRRDTPGEVVLYASDVDHVAGSWTVERDPSAAGGTRLFNRDAGALKVTAPLAAPADYVDFTFTADAGVPYRLWIRGKALNDHWSNDSVFVQFSDSVDSGGNATWRIGTTSGTSVNLEDCSNCGLAGWGWQDNGYGAGVLGTAVRFGASGTHTIRVQVREDGFSIDQIVLSAARYFNGSPGSLKRDSRVLAQSNSGAATDPPSSSDPREIVIHPGVSASVAGAWISEASTTAASGRRVRHPDAGAPKLTTALAAPANYFEVTFDALAGVEYRLWLRGRAQNDYWGNDSVFAQFDGSVNASGASVWRIGSTSATDVNLEECSGCGLAAWGWQDNGWGGVGVPGPTVRFAATGRQRMRVQTREDGFAIDQIVISAGRYLTEAPGTAKNDATIVPR